jgi:hypothetical protein
VDMAAKRAATRWYHFKGARRELNGGGVGRSRVTRGGETGERERGPGRGEKWLGRPASSPGQRARAAALPREGPEKATRGGEWEPTKNPRRNLTYILKSTHRPSLLTQPRQHSCKSYRP